MFPQECTLPGTRPKGKGPPWTPQGLAHLRTHLPEIRISTTTRKMAPRVQRRLGNAMPARGRSRDWRGVGEGVGALPLRRCAACGHLPIIPQTTHRPTAQQQSPNTEKQDARPAKGAKRKEASVFSKYYASTQSCARMPEERSVVTCRTPSSSPERSRHRRTRSSPKFSLRWLAA